MIGNSSLVLKTVQLRMPFTMPLLNDRLHSRPRGNDVYWPSRIEYRIRTFQRRPQLCHPHNRTLVELW